MQTPLDCVVERRKQLAAFLKANPIDISFPTQDGPFDAQKTFDQLPPDPKPPSMFDDLVPRRIPITEYELLLSRFRQIERAVSAHRTERKEAAKKLLDAAKDQTKEAVSLVKNLGDNFRSPTDKAEDTKIAIQRHPEMVQKTSTALATARQAMAKDSDQRRMQEARSRTYN